MRIYLARHGESIASGNDNERPLSEKGKSDIGKIAEFIFTRKISVERVIQSEKFRAQQTAKLLCASLNGDFSIETSAYLDPMASPDLILDEINAEEKDTLLVGHMPFMGSLVAKLMTGYENKTIANVETGSLICLEKIESDYWILCWMVNPSIL